MGMGPKMAYREANLDSTKDDVAERLWSDHSETKTYSHAMAGKEVCTQVPS